VNCGPNYNCQNTIFRHLCAIDNTFQQGLGIFLNAFSKLSDFVDHIYAVEFEIKDITDTTRPASYLDLNLEIDREGRLRTKTYDKRDDFNFHFPFLCYNIPAALVFGIYISQLIRYSRACASYRDLLDIDRVATNYFSRVRVARSFSFLCSV
jgi:hypothetical protein